MSASSPIVNDFEPSREFTDSYGFVPNLFRIQDCLPQAVAVEAQLIAAVVLTGGKLTRQQKEGLLHAVAGGEMTIVWPSMRKLLPAMTRKVLRCLTLR